MQTSYLTSDPNHLTSDPVRKTCVREFALACSHRRSASKCEGSQAIKSNTSKFLMVACYLRDTFVPSRKNMFMDESSLYKIAGNNKVPHLETPGTRSPETSNYNERAH
jgi:hypothetical protein